MRQGPQVDLILLDGVWARAMLCVQSYTSVSMSVHTVIPDQPRLSDGRTIVTGTAAHTVVTNVVTQCNAECNSMLYQ